ncbi:MULTISPECIES: DUF3037 domain-containing protein [unclassified Psychrobacter]|uniref:DUF3037 domain-containing protein n=1 Tax=unclassified Psychrobacter TaxID=196806 RepID=UPI0018F48B11|nr:MULTISPECIES: DUF3037 domain-containing protein [unclassified Psychrobacter]
MNTSWYGLIDDTIEQPSHSNLISGEWFTVRFTPDFIANEIFNIGVVFVDDDKRCHYKMIENANAFSCLFGSTGVANINFLLKIVKTELTANNYTLTPSGHIFYSHRQTAQGSSVSEILEDLFGSMVSLVCKGDTEVEPIKDTPSTLSTNKLRSKVFSQMRDKYGSLYEKVYHKEPYEITDDTTGDKIIVDMPIRHYSGVRSGTKRVEYYGSIVSAAYLDQVHRIHHINYIGATNVMNCCELLGKDVRTALIIYLPPDDSLKFTKPLRLQIENELDRCLYSLHKMESDGFNIKIEVKESPEECLEEVVEFLT